MYSPRMLVDQYVDQRLVIFMAQCVCGNVLGLAWLIITMQIVQQRSPERFMTDTPSSRRNLVGNF